MIAIVILMSLLSGSSFEPGIDYSPRLLHREVVSIFGEKDYRLTELPPAVPSADEIRVNGKFFKISSTGGESLVAYIGRVNSCRADGCSNPLTDRMDTESEYFDYFILFGQDKRVRLVRVFNYAATHGQEVAVKKWLDQFSGYDSGRPLRVGKEIDAISGATISVYAIVADVQEKMKLLTRYLL